MFLNKDKIYKSKHELFKLQFRKSKIDNKVKIVQERIYGATNFQGLTYFNINLNKNNFLYRELIINPNFSTP